MVLVWKCPTDVRIQRPSSFGLCEYGVLLTTRIGDGHLTCRTYHAFYFTQPTHLLVCCLNLRTPPFPYYVITSN